MKLNLSPTRKLQTWEVAIEANHFSSYNKKFNQLAYIDAIEIYKDLVAEGFKSYDVFKKIAEAYYYNGKYSQAQEWYKKITENYADSVSAEHYFRYAQTLRATKEYDESDDMMQIFTSLSGNDFRAK